MVIAGEKDRKATTQTSSYGHALTQWDAESFEQDHAMFALGLRAASVSRSGCCSVAKHHSKCGATHNVGPVGDNTVPSM